MKDNKEAETSYCALRADNRERWAFIEQHLEDDHRTALDIGCAEGYFTDAVAEFGLEVTGIEVAGSALRGGYIGCRETSG